MYNSESDISRKELEQLCMLYLERCLTHEEEECLALVLSASAERGGIIDDTIFLMGLTKSTSALLHLSNTTTPSISHPSSTADNHPKQSNGSALVSSSASGRTSESGRSLLKRSFRRIALSSAAAALIIAAISAIWRTAYPESSDSDQIVYTVIIEGKEVKDPSEAKRFAKSQYDKGMALIAQMQKLEKEHLEKLEERMDFYENTVKITEENFRMN